MFRKLKASEIDCRVSICRNDGLSLLLYKDARVDMRILDETVGPMNWQKKYSRENANCTVSLWDAEKEQWISKEDTGTESFTEAEKGLASDSFKRACFNWGIGRELYTAPFIWIPASACTIKEGRNGKPACYDRFKVTEIDYDESGNINLLEIINEKTGAVVYKMGDAPEETVGEDFRLKALRTLLEENGITDETICKLYKVASLSDLTEKQHANIANNIGKIKEAQDESEASPDVSEH